jgi:hypothetical protein
MDGRSAKPTHAPATAAAPTVAALDAVVEDIGF